MTRLTIICSSFLVVSLVFAGQSYAKVDSENILGAWLLDEGKGDITEDASGNGNNGTLRGGPNWIDGKFGKALDFSGTNSHVDCGNADSFNVEVFSVSFWYNFPSIQYWNHMISKGQHVASGTPGSVNWGVMMYSDEQRILFETYDNTSWTGISADSSAGEWHHVVATFDGSTMQFYHDGQLAGTSGAGITLDPSRPLLIGARSDAGSAGGFFSGSIDEVGFFNIVLAPEDIETIMNIGLGAVTGGITTARNPVPANGAIHEDTWVSLSWRPGDFAVSHDVYLGEDFAGVNDGTRESDVFRGNYASAFYVAGFPGYAYPEGFVPGTTYYWRIDEVNEADPNSPWKGEVWSFMVPPKTAYAPDPPDGARFLEPDVQLEWTAGFGSKLHTVYFGDNFEDVNSATGGLPQGITTYTPASLELEKTYYWRVDEFDAINTYKGDVWSFTTTKEGGGVRADYYTGMNFENLVLTRIEPQINFSWGDPGGPDPSVGDDNFSARWTGEVEAVFTETYTFYTNSDDGVRLWVDGQELVNNWTDHATIENKGKIDLVGGNSYSIVMEYYENGGGAVAELRWESPRTPKQLIPQAALSLPVKASSPNPNNRAVDVSQIIVLSWGAGEAATSHEVYFGTDADAVQNADTASPEYKGSRNLGSESYDPGKLEWGITFYWRVDEIEADGTIQTGNIWSFTTANFLVVDDFEDYDAGENQIWYSWKDGLGYGMPGTDPYYAGNGSGSAVGDENTPSYTEETIVHGGLQAMPLFYDNNKQGFFKYSEAELTLTDSRDWTEHSVNMLSIWFRGDSANAAETLYVALNGSAVVTNDNPDAALITDWTEWNIDLQAFADQGVNLANVNTIALGLGNKKNPLAGGSGVMYFDDIRLYTPPEPAP